MDDALTSSGDIIADRRFAEGRRFSRAGDFAAALALFSLVVERAPRWASGWLALGRAKAATFDPAGAVEAFREALRLDPEDAAGAGLELARMDASVTIDAAPAAYVAGLFDAYAPDFDRHLVERLDYRTPQKLAALTRAAHGDGKFSRVLDLGCGTGLSGEAFSADASWLEGVDLSNGMISQARIKGVYDDLTCSDIVSHLSHDGPSYDLIVAADVLIYLGELRPVFSAVSSRLEPAGLFAFSVEHAPGADYTLRESLRFAHSGNYIRAAINLAGLEIVSMEHSILRKDRGADIEGLLVLARKPAYQAESDAPSAHAAKLAEPKLC